MLVFKLLFKCPNFPNIFFFVWIIKSQANSRFNRKKIFSLFLLASDLKNHESMSYVAFDENNRWTIRRLKLVLFFSIYSNYNLLNTGIKTCIGYLPYAESTTGISQEGRKLGVCQLDVSRLIYTYFHSW